MIKNDINQQDFKIVNLQFSQFSLTWSCWSRQALLITTAVIVNILYCVGEFDSSGLGGFICDQLVFIITLVKATQSDQNNLFNLMLRAYLLNKK